MSKRQINAKGFTIVELIIAMSIFSLVLLLITTGILTIGKRYYKGITTSRTQDATRSVVDDITRSLQISGETTVVRPAVPAIGSPTYGDVRSLCVGRTRYTYVLNSINSPSAPNPNTRRHAMWLDVMKPGQACTPLAAFASSDRPSDGDTTSDQSAAARNQARDLIPDNMRVTQFDINPIGSLYNVRLQVIYGVDDVIDPQDVTNASDDICRSSDVGGQFCAASYINTFVKQRL